ncbi:MAG: hypothetical protein ACI81L_002045, partial [Verrucomicrobiales bacterium]
LIDALGIDFDGGFDGDRRLIRHSHAWSISTAI